MVKILCAYPGLKCSLTPYGFYDVYIIVNTFITGKGVIEFFEILINIAQDFCAF